MTSPGCVTGKSGEQEADNICQAVAPMVRAVWSPALQVVWRASWLCSYGDWTAVDGAPLPSISLDGQGSRHSAPSSSVSCFRLRTLLWFFFLLYIHIGLYLLDLFH